MMEKSRRTKESDQDKVRLTFSLSKESYDRLRELAEYKDATMADIFRESLRREFWLEATLNDPKRQLLIRDMDSPEELRQLVNI